jgi:phage protein D/phage baseplate assembly protein gpV
MAAEAAQHVAGLSLLVAGNEMDPGFRDNIVEVRVRDSLSLPASALIRINDPKAEHVDDHPLQLGKEVEIKMGGLADQATASVFKGEVVAMEPDFAKTGCTIAVRCYDVSHRLQRNTKVRTFQQVSADNMVNKVCQEAGLSGSCESTNFVYKFFQQSGETDRDFIRRFERAYDFEFVIENGQYKFRKAGKANGSAVELRYGENLLSFRPRISAVQQVKDAEVRGWDPMAKREIVSSSSSPATSSSPAITRAQVAGTFPAAKLLVADRTVESSSESDKMAAATLGRRAESFIEAEGTCMGNPAIRAGKQVKIASVGSKFSGTYYVSSTQHVYRGAKGYQTIFEIAGRSSRGLLDLVHPPPKRDWSASLVVGLVTNVNDPDNLGRVRVKFPTLPDQSGPAEGNWARIASVASGNARGLLMLPHVDDEVVVAFENGDTRRPIILGSMFNGKDKPGDELLQEKKGSFAMVSTEKGFMHTKDDFTIKSDKKMILTVQTDVEEKVGGKQTSETSGDVKTKTSASYTLEAGSSIKIKAPNVEIEASGSLKLKGATVDIEGSGPTSVKGATLDLQGQSMTNVKGAIINLG